MHIIPYPRVNLVDMIREIHRRGHDEEGEEGQDDYIWDFVSGDGRRR